MIGFDAGPDGDIFLLRLRAALERRGQFSVQNPDVWVQPADQDLPDWVAARRRQGQTRVLARMGGCHSMRRYWFKKPALMPFKPLDDWASARFNRRRNRPVKENLRHADGLVFQSEFARELAWRFVAQSEPGTIIYNGVDLAEFSPEGRQSDMRLPHTVNILMTARQPAHRLQDGFRILEKLVNQSRQAYHLHVLAGDAGVVPEADRRVADALKLREGLHYTVYGGKAASEMATLYRACDLLLDLSYWEACPNTVIEALACGLPVVGVNFGGVAELVGVTGGILVDEVISFSWQAFQDAARLPQAPAEGYAQAILKLCAELSKYKKRARATAVKRFDIEKVCDEYLLAAHQVAERSVGTLPL